MNEIKLLYCYDAFDYPYTEYIIKKMFNCLIKD